MGKYDQIPLKEVKARTQHQCRKCGKTIQAGERYYTQKDRFLQTLHSPKFCSKCYEEYGAKLLEKQKIQAPDNKTRKLDNYLESNKKQAFKTKS